MHYKSMNDCKNTACNISCMFYVDLNANLKKVSQLHKNLYLFRATMMCFCGIK